MLGWFKDFVLVNRPYIDVAQALSAVLNIVGWCLGGLLLFFAWRRNAVRSVSVMGATFHMQEAAVEAAAAAARDWSSQTKRGPIDIGRIRDTMSRAFDKTTVDNLIGKAVLWVDDNPSNNTLVVRALRRMQLDVDLATSTEAGLKAMDQRNYDLVISDMGRDTNMQAGYELLAEIRGRGNAVPFLIFAGDDKPEYRKTAAERGAQLSTNDMIELLDAVIGNLSKS